MVLQYRLKTEKRWKDYPGKEKLTKKIDNCEFRLLSEDRKKILAEKGPYEKIMKRFRQIEFFKHKK